MASFSRRKKQGGGRGNETGTTSTDSIPSTPVAPPPAKPQISEPIIQTTSLSPISPARSDISTSVYSDTAEPVMLLNKHRPPTAKTSIKTPLNSRSGLLSPRPYRTPTNATQIRTLTKTNSIPTPQYTKSPPVRVSSSVHCAPPLFDHSLPQSEMGREIIKDEILVTHPTAYFFILKYPISQKFSFLSIFGSGPVSCRLCF